jgi:membrane peptidoglycan carboxypeptidase
MADKLKGMELDGELSMEIQFQVDLPDRENPGTQMGLNNGCKVKSVPEALVVSKLKKPFKYQAHRRDGEPWEISSGPGSKKWVPIQLMSRYIPICIRTMEDPGFWAHDGFHVEAIENSIKENIRTGKFVRGASTISMQLAKNLWLQREKTASRKLQEAFLTMYLEQELTKEQILELYTNVVEFGPDVYGIKAAAHHYFRTHPINLSLGQSLFLASILPKPNSYYFLSDGKLTPGRAMRLRGMMKAMKAKGRISEDEYQEGIREVLIFRQPSTSSVDAQEEIPVTVDGIDPESWGD